MYWLGVWLVESLVFVRKALWVEPVLRSICEQVGRGLRADRLPYIRGRGRMRLGERVCLSGRSCFYFMNGVTDDPRIEIGDDVFIGNQCTLSAARQITIGSHCLISTGVRIHDNDGHPVDAGRRRRGEKIAADECAAVVIEENVWVGANAIILKGVRIGANAVIGAGAVVTGNVPADSVAAGNPVRVVRGLTDSRTR